MTWAERIEMAKLTGTFTRQDVELACSWATCAVGEHYGEYKEAIRAGMTIRGIPADHTLLMLGAQFMHFVVGNNILGAEIIHQKINLRMVELNNG